MIRIRGNPLLHFVDRYAGIPAVTLLGRARFKRTLPSTIQSIGILKAGAIGDTVLISAVVRDLRAAFPHASVVFFSGESNFEIASLLEGVDQVVKLSVTNLVADWKSIRSVAVDVMLDFGQWSRMEALFSLYSRAAFTVGFCTPGQHRHCGYDVSVAHLPEVHELTNFRRLANALGVKTQNLPLLRTAPRDFPLAREYAVFHLWPGGSRRKLKEWPLDRWLLLIEQFATWDIPVILTGAPSDRDCNNRLMAGVSSHARGFVKNAAGLVLKETAETLAGAMLVVSVDTGLMHMAAALGVPLVALHGPTSSKRWGPVSDSAVVVESPAEGCGYISLGWEESPELPACMDCITYEIVRDVCLEILEKHDRFTQGKVETRRYAQVLENP
jgi:ADP-heptose:LPS heptosyltransferase